MEIQDIRTFLDSDFMVVCKILLFLLLLPVNFYNLYKFWMDTEKRKSTLDYVIMFVVVVLAVILPLFGIFYYWGTGFSWTRFFVYIYCIIQIVWDIIIIRFVVKGRISGFLRLMFGEIIKSDNNKRP